MFRSIDGLRVSLESMITMPITVYLSVRCTVWCAQVLRDGVIGGHFGFAAAILEEFAEHSGGFWLEQTSFSEEGVVEAGISGNIVEGTCVSGFGIWGRVDQA